MLDAYRKHHNSELFNDVRRQYTDSLRAGIGSDEAVKQLIDAYNPALSDDDDAPVFWFALAEKQWELGRLEEPVRSNALIQIDQQLHSLIDQPGSSVFVNELTAFRRKLLSPQPQKQTIKPFKLYHTDWKAGDVFAYCLDGERAGNPAYQNAYVYFVVRGAETWYPGHTIPVVYVYWTVTKEPLELEQLKEKAYLPQFYKPIVYKNNPLIRKKYSLALLSTSIRVIPKKRLTFMGNIGAIGGIEGEDPSAYHVSWKMFDQYMIENYTSWN